MHDTYAVIHNLYMQQRISNSYIYRLTQDVMHLKKPVIIKTKPNQNKPMKITITKKY